MSALRTSLASLTILAAGGAVLAAATDRFQAYTTESARRLDVRAHPRVLPPASLETASDEVIELASLRGRWLLVDFMYTRCLTYCTVLGNEFARLQERLAGPIAAGRVALLSISFDPAHDDPEALAAYQARSRDRGTGWIAARPTSAGSLAALMHTFGVTAIPDGMGGYIHNAAIAVVDPAGRLVAIMDWDAPGEAEQYVRRGLGQ